MLVKHYLKKILNEYKEAQLRKEALAQLNALSDKELKDIGLCRGSIREAVEKRPVSLYDKYS